LLPLLKSTPVGAEKRPCDEEREVTTEILRGRGKGGKGKGQGQKDPLPSHYSPICLSWREQEKVWSLERARERSLEELEELARKIGALN